MLLAFLEALTEVFLVSRLRFGPRNKWLSSIFGKSRWLEFGAFSMFRKRGFAGFLLPLGMFPSPVKPGPWFLPPLILLSSLSSLSSSCLSCHTCSASPLSVSCWWTLLPSHYCFTSAKRPAHKRPRDRTSSVPSTSPQRFLVR